MSTFKEIISVSESHISNPIEILQNESMNWRLNTDMIHHILKTINMGKDANNVKGRLGEYIFAYNTNKTLRKYGYIQSFKSIPNSYTLRHYYRGQKGIDYYLRITDSNNNIYKYLIEVANWKKLRYQMNYFYKTRLVSKFYTWDRLNRYQHVIAINHRNISYIEEQLKNDKVLVIKFKEHYTPELIKKIVERKEIDISPYSINYPI